MSPCAVTRCESVTRFDCPPQLRRRLKSSKTFTFDNWAWNVLTKGVRGLAFEGGLMIKVQLEGSLRKTSMKLGLDVCDVRGWLPIEPYGAMDAREPPLVLILQVRAVAPAHHLHNQRVHHTATTAGAASAATVSCRGRRGERVAHVKLDGEA